MDKKLIELRDKITNKLKAEKDLPLETFDMALWLTENTTHDDVLLLEATDNELTDKILDDAFTASGKYYIDQEGALRLTNCNQASN